MTILFFARDYDGTPTASAGMDLVFQIWRPSWTSLRPADIPLYPSAVWWLVHQLGRFQNSEYGVAFLLEGVKVVHRSFVLPGCFRYPFMNRADLQIGDTFTYPSYRGRGLAVHCIRKIMAASCFPGRRFWYIVSENNHDSIRVAEKSGFRLVAKGTFESRFGISALGAYRPRPVFAGISHGDSGLSQTRIEEKHE